MGDRELLECGYGHLEVVDAGLDSVAEVVRLPALVGSRVLKSGQRTADRINQAIAVPGAAAAA